jgi:hypothetical protein
MFLSKREINRIMTQIQINQGAVLKWTPTGRQKEVEFKLATHGSCSGMALPYFKEFIHNPCSTA